MAKIQYKIALSLAILVLRKKIDRLCMGIKHCEFVDPEIINLYHSEVDFDLEYWQKIKDNEQAETKKSKTYAYI